MKILHPQICVCFDLQQDMNLKQALFKPWPLAYAQRSLSTCVEKWSSLAEAHLSIP